ncbi:MAG: prolyl oligopeptidase family serine peptidase [Lentisphaeria bacterium]|nr:prolyl oligopeptidase family serine peptidase [Lentisphaeria bacterium]
MKKFITWALVLFLSVIVFAVKAELPQKEGIFTFGNNKAYVYLPDNFQKGKPCKFILFFHGAGYSNGQPGNVGHKGFEKFRKMAAEKGYIIAVPSYGTTWYNRKAENITKAMLHALEQEFGFQLNRIHVMGGSMGGLSALVWSSRNMERVSSICTFFAVADIVDQYNAKAHHAKAMISAYGGDYNKKPYWYESRRAINYASILAQVPIMLVHGDKDVLVSMNQSEKLYNAIKNVGGTQVEFVKVPGRGHDNNIILGLEEKVFDFIGKYNK